MSALSSSSFSLFHSLSAAPQQRLNEGLELSKGLAASAQHACPRLGAFSSLSCDDKSAATLACLVETCLSATILSWQTQRHFVPAAFRCPLAVEMQYSESTSPSSQLPVVTSQLKRQQSKASLGLFFPRRCCSRGTTSRLAEAASSERFPSAWDS